MRHEDVWPLLAMCGGYSACQPRRQWRDETMIASHKHDSGMKLRLASIGALTHIQQAEKMPFLN